MNRSTWVVFAASAAALCAASSADDAEKRSLEERVAELERKIARLEGRNPIVVPGVANRQLLFPGQSAESAMPPGAVAPTPDGRGYFFPASGSDATTRSTD